MGDQPQTFDLELRNKRDKPKEITIGDSSIEPPVAANKAVEAFPVMENVPDNCIEAFSEVPDNVEGTPVLEPQPQPDTLPGTNMVNDNLVSPGNEMQNMILMKREEAVRRREQLLLIRQKQLEDQHTMLSRQVSKHTSQYYNFGSQFGQSMNSQFGHPMSSQIGHSMGSPYQYSQPNIAWTQMNSLQTFNYPLQSGTNMGRQFQYSPQFPANPWPQFSNQQWTPSYSQQQGAGNNGQSWFPSNGNNHI